ncbi:MAG: hypothetical protein IT178_16450 [Acidobacteria bacterium]|nr:hypothetical protein [Acidobacteriota bacterium]
MSRTKDWLADHPPADTDLEDCEFAQYERELRADPAFSEWLEILEKQRKEMKHGDHGERLGRA